MSQEGGTQVTLGQGERRMGVGLDSRHLVPPPPTPESGIVGHLGHLTSGPAAASGLGVFSQADLLWYHCPAHAWTFALEVTHMEVAWGHL